MVAQIFFHVDYKPPKYKVSSQLCQALNLVSTIPWTKTYVILTLWNYIKRHQLHDPTTGFQIKLNQALKFAFGVDEMTYEDVPRLLSTHLGPPDPLQISYPITLTSQPKEMWYEMMVDVPHFVEPFNFMYNKQEINKIESEIHEALHQFDMHRSKKRFFEEFAEDPIPFIEDFITSQLHNKRVRITSDPTSFTSSSLCSELHVGFNVSICLLSPFPIHGMTENTTSPGSWFYLGKLGISQS
eukprot:TRINITY_DN8821_c0_g1_i1.p1 TRINITY_DN8821_c0_g1~~TRINITY_DN8821_c0_g1_i1.p1  ORF type:complete len:241 (-),score=50.06 TRINITY_DN8821_c0_g1_i1:463-1185(-)